MPILHMETDAVRGVAQQLKANAGTIQTEHQNLNGSVQNLTSVWQGGSADQFLQQAQALLTQIQQVLQQGDELGNRLEREVVEWEQVAAVLGGGVTGAAAGGASSSILNHFGAGKAAGWFSETAASGALGALIDESQPNVDTPPFEKLGDWSADSDLQMYKMNMEDLSNFNPHEMAEALDAKGRPVIFLVHGWKTVDPDESYMNFMNELGKDDSLADAKPIIIGVEWSSGDGLNQGGAANAVNTGLAAGIATGIRTGITTGTEKGVIAGIGKGVTAGAITGGRTGITTILDFDESNKEAEQVGSQFGDFLESFERHNPESGVNVISHSLGAKVVLEAVTSNKGAKVDRFLAIQGAVDVDKLQAGGKYAAALDRQRVAQFDATTNQDPALFIRENVLSGYGKSLGSGKKLVGGIGYHEIDTWNSMGHSSIGDESLHSSVIPSHYSSEHPFSQIIDRGY